MTLHSILLVVHVVISASIIGLVLLQRGKGADAGAAFGSGSSGTVFGAKGSANFLSRSTAVLATLFFASSLSLAYLGTSRPVVPSLMDEQPRAENELPSAMSLDAETAESIDELPLLPALDDSGADLISEPESGGD